MKEKFSEYLEKNGMKPGEQKNRFFNLYHEVCRLMPEEPTEIFLEKTGIVPEISPVDSLWFFANCHAAEARRFIEQDDIEIFPLSSLKSLRIVSENFNWESLKPLEASAKSTLLRVEFQPAFRETISLKASGEACGSLGLIVLNYLRTNL